MNRVGFDCTILAQFMIEIQKQKFVLENFCMLEMEREVGNIYEWMYCGRSIVERRKKCSGTGVPVSFSTPFVPLFSSSFEMRNFRPTEDANRIENTARNITAEDSII